MQQRPRFRTVMVTGGIILMLIPSLIAGWIYTGALQRQAEKMVEERLRGRVEVATNQIARRLYGLWSTVDRFAKTISTDAPADLSRSFTTLATFNESVSWLGLADVNGTVLAASQKMLEGENVSQRPWFRHGLNGPFAGDVHEAVLLAKLMGRGNEPTRFIDFASAVKNAEGASIGVVGLHVDWEWVKGLLASLNTPNIELLLIADDGRVLFGPNDLVDKQLSIGTIVAARQGRPVTRAEQWPDRRIYMTSVVPAVQYRDLPNFGWSLIARQDLGVALGPTRDLVGAFWKMLAAAAVVSCVLLILGAGWLTTPLRRLTAFGKQLAEGRVDAPPHEETRYREAADLSGILVRLQSRLESQSVRDSAEGGSDDKASLQRQHA